MQSDQPGTAAVIDGVLVVTPPHGDGRPASIACDPGVHLSEDGLSASVRDEFPSLQIHVEIARDELTATIAVERAPGARYRLVDQPPATAVTLRRVATERIPCSEPTREELLAALAEHGVVEGIDAEAVDRLAHGEFGPLPVARGRAATAGVDGRVQLGQIDESTERFVREGVLLARITPAEAGTEGVTVTGRRLDPGEPRPPRLTVGEGVNVEDDGRVVAAIDGHVRLHERTVCVTPALRLAEVRGRDEDLSSPGSIDIAGSVESGARVRARRTIVIGDQVRAATVEAGFSLHIEGGAFDAQLRAGHTGAVLTRVAALLAPIAAEVTRLHAGVVQLLAATRDTDRALHPVRALAIMLERITPDLEGDVKRALAEADRERGTVPHDILAALRGAAEDLDLMRGGRVPIDALPGVAERFDREASRLRFLTAAGSELRVGLLQKCDVEVIGALRVTGKGVVDSAVRVFGPLEVAGADALIRGGRLLLDGEGVATELAPGANGLEIELAPGAVLRAGIIQPGVIIHLPDATRRVSRVLTDAVILAEEQAA